MKLEIKETGVFINDIEINEEIFNQEKSDYSIVDREDQIDHLIDWISECGRDRESYKALMKEDLKYLIGLSDTDLFSSISTNEFIAKSDNEERFNEICKGLLALNK